MNRTISVVIPTIGRPVLGRAIESVLAQTVQPHEILVMADTIESIEVPNNPRIKLLRVGPGAGGNVARQAGVEAARGELVALLDDDDEWYPYHLENQLALIPAEAHQNHDWIATSRLHARYLNGKTEVWPKRLKSDTETLPQYIFRKHSVFGGVGFIQASTLLFPKELGLSVPFDQRLKFHQDVAWLVDLANREEDISVYQAHAPSVVYHIGSLTVSKKITAGQSIAWANRLDPGDLRTLGDFIVVHAIQSAKNTGSVKHMLKTILTGLKLGRPGVPAIVYSLLLVARVAALRLLGRKA